MAGPSPTKPGTEVSPESLPASSPPVRIFDRERNGHPWEKAFAEMSRPDLERRWVVAANWRMDHRVSEDRETSDLEASGHFEDVSDVRKWWRARSLYFQREICRPSRPTSSGELISAYVRAANDENLVQAEIAEFDQLVHVGSLNAMLRRISRGNLADEVDAALRRLATQGLPLRGTEPDASGWFDAGASALAQTLSSRGNDAVRQVAGLLVEAMGSSQPPWWAGFAEEIEESLARRDARAACIALGLGHRTMGEWLLMWRYPISVAAPLYRPTAIEANDSPYHFPSPPDHPWGITMPLASEIPACREILHPPLRGVAAVDYCTGELLLLEDLPSFGDNDELAALRAGHRRRLQREFPGPSLSAWLDRHPEPLP